MACYRMNFTFTFIVYFQHRVYIIKLIQNILNVLYFTSVNDQNIIACLKYPVLFLV